MRRVLLAVALGGTAVLVAPTVPASAACVPAGISVFPPSGPRGSTFTVSGRGFYRSCSDLLSQPTPDRGIRLEFVASGKSTALGSVDASTDGSFDHQATVPNDAPSGEGLVRAVGSSSTQSTSFLVTSSTSTTAPTTTTSTTIGVRRTTSSSSATTSTSTTIPVSDTLSPQPAPEIDPPTGGSDSTLAAGRPRRSDGGDDWGATPYIVLGIVLLGGAIAGVSARLYRHLGPPPSG